MIEIIAHRGEWRERVSSNKTPNSWQAFEEALNHGYGVEVDIRDYQGNLVVSHNPADESSFLLQKLLALYHGKKLSSTLAFNIKADGLQKLLQTQLAQYDISRYFTFDMSIPNTLTDAQANLRYFLRQSEFERELPSLGTLYQQCAGIWVDQFEFNNEILQYNLSSIPMHLNNHKQICWVSAELHPWGRNNNYHLEGWTQLKKILHKLTDATVCLCTDYPNQAKEFFHATN